MHTIEWFSRTSRLLHYQLFKVLSRCLATAWLLLTLSLVSGCQTIAPELPSARVLAFQPQNGDPMLSHVRSLLSEEKIGITGYSPSLIGSLANLSELDIGRRNALLANYYIREESPYYRCTFLESKNCLIPPSAPIKSGKSSAPLRDSQDWPAGLPRTCLALSGGGTRSAAFSIGVMQALAESKMLDEVDIISGVSGGSYALSWYLTSKLNAEARAGRRLTDQIVLDEKEIAVRSLSKHPGLISTPYGVLAIGTNTLNQALKLLTGEDNAANNPYWSALYVTFLSGDCKDCIVDGRFLMKDLKRYISLDRLPFPIIGLNARSRAQGRCDAPGAPRIPLEQAYFEVTPLRQGGLGAYTDTGMGLSIADAVALSGAAVSVPSAKYCAIAEAAGQSLGSWWEYMSMSHVPAESTSDNQPLPRMDYKKTERFLADGGHSENLAVYPLIQRMCQTIIVVDAEHDPNLVFEGFHLLSKEMEQRGLYWTKPITNKFDQVPSSLRNDRKFSADNIKDPIFTGRIGPLPFYHLMEGSSGSSFVLSQLEMNVHYIKLSIDGNSVDLGQCDRYLTEGRQDLARYCLEKRSSIEKSMQWGCGSGLLSDCPFPHYPTTKQNLSIEQFDALRALGRASASKVMRNKN